MEEQPAFYPIKVISRSVKKRRLRRVSGLALSAALRFWLPVGAHLISPVHPGHMDHGAGRTPAIAPVIVASPACPLARTSHCSSADGGNAAAARNCRNPARSIYPLALNLKVENGDTLISLLTDSGVSYQEAHNVVASMRTLYNPKKLNVGQNVAVQLDKNPEDARNPVDCQPVAVHVAHRYAGSHAQRQDDFTAKKLDVPVERKLARAGGRIDGSLYETGAGAGPCRPRCSGRNHRRLQLRRRFPARHQVRRHAWMYCMNASRPRSGASAGTGNMVYAELDLGDRRLKIYRYVDKDGNADYYNEKGESVRKALLRTPVNGAKITSGFGMRNHPILGYSKMHRGVDFGAPTGTPIYAAGDGTVDFAGRKGGYGNYLRIKHNDCYASAYGHISRFAAGITPGHHVKQGQVVAYVGQTGLATGPHLHYEILVNNEQVNPASVKFKAGNVLAGNEMAAFRKNMEQNRRRSSPTRQDRRCGDGGLIPAIPSPSSMMGSSGL